MNSPRPAADPTQSTFDELGRTCRSLLSRTRALVKMTADVADLGTQHSRARSAMHFLESAMNSLHPQAGIRLDDARNSTAKYIASQAANHLIEGLDVPSTGTGSVFRADKPALAGHSSTITLPEILAFLSSYQKTGVLEVTSLGETVVIGLRNGEVVHASSDNAPAGLRLGEILVSKGLIEERQLYSVLGQLGSAQRAGLRLGDVLERNCGIPKDSIRAALEFQIQQLFHRLFLLQEACYAFYEREASGVVGALQMNVMHLLLESATRADGRPADCETVAQPAVQAEQPPPQAA